MSSIPANPRNVLCSSISASDIRELAALAEGARNYFARHGTLPSALEDGSIFHHINALNTWHFVHTNGEADNCILINYKDWADTLRRITVVLAPYLVNAFSPLPSPRILPSSDPIPIPPPAALTACFDS
jgi:hypothetical protein